MLTILPGDDVSKQSVKGKRKSLLWVAVPTNSHCDLEEDYTDQRCNWLSID